MYDKVSQNMRNVTKARKVGEIVRKNETISWDSGPKADKSAKG